MDPKVLAAQVTALKADLAEAARARFVTKLIATDVEYAAVRNHLQAKLDATQDALALAEKASALRPGGSPEELAEWWDAASLVKKRAAMREAFRAVYIDPVGKGKGNGGCKFDTSRVHPDWHPFSGTTRRIATNPKPFEEPTPEEIEAQLQANREVEDAGAA
jgi:hypothetical protein